MSMELGPDASPKYERVLLKLSGEALAGERGFGIEPAVVDRLTDEVKAVHEMGVSLGLVIGGGNIVRGALASQKGMDRVQADYMGMLGTIINALAVQDLAEHQRGKAMALFNAAFNVGYSIGVFGLGFLAAAAGYPPVFAVASAIAALAVLVLATDTRRVGSGA